MPGQKLEDASESQARQERQQKCLEAKGSHHDFKRLAGLAYIHGVMHACGLRRPVVPNPGKHACGFFISLAYK